LLDLHRLTELLAAKNASRDARYRDISARLGVTFGAPPE
jgi:hypothetical protein